MTTLTLTQLNSALTSEQIGKTRDSHLVTPPEGEPAPDPVAEEIAAACAKVDTCTAGWLVAAALATAYARDLAAWRVAKRLGKPTEDQDAAKDRALKELEEIRDGKFGSLQRDPDAEPAEAPKIKGGSRPKVI